MLVQNTLLRSTPYLELHDFARERVYYLRAMVRMADRDVLVKAGLLRASPRTNNVCSTDNIIGLFLTLENVDMLHTKTKIVQGLMINLFINDSCYCMVVNGRKQ